MLLPWSDKTPLLVTMFEFEWASSIIMDEVLEGRWVFVTELGRFKDLVVPVEHESVVQGALASTELYDALARALRAPGLFLTLADLQGGGAAS